MIFYLDTGHKFFISFDGGDLIFLLYNGDTESVAIKASRWVSSRLSKPEHIDSILGYMKSDDLVNSGIGKAMLEQLLKMKIYGEITGHS